MGTPEEIGTMFRMLDRARTNLIQEVISLVYFMRGSVQYRDMMDMSKFERQSIQEFIEKRLDAESKKTYPVY